MASRPPRASPSGSAGRRSGRPITSSSPTRTAGEYGRIYEAILTLAWVGARHPRIRLGTSVIVVPQRNAVILAKELATLDSLSGGRVIAGVGIGWNEPEFANLAVADRFHVRGAYLDETIRLWRHLWSGATEPFRGRFHTIEDFVFGPLPVQTPLPIVIGGRAEPALRRAGTLADGYHSSATGPAGYAKRLEVISAAATAAGRPMPALSARVRVQFDGPADVLVRHARLARGDGGRGARVGRDRRRAPGAFLPGDRPGRGRQSRGTVRPRGRPARLAGDGLEDDLVDVAPHPVLARLERADDRVPRVACVLARVAVRG